MSKIPEKGLFKSKNKEECLIIGNGPSFKESLNNSDGFNGKQLICVNHFPKTEYYERLKPSIYVTSAPDLWLDDIDERFVKQSNELFETMASKTSWPLTFYVPFESKKHKRWKAPLLKNKNIEIRYYNNTPVEGWEWFEKIFFSLNLGMPRPHNVMIPSIFLSVNAGFKKIFLIGADHSWLSEISVNDQNKVLINQKHFYDENTSKAMPLDKRGKGERKLFELLHKFMLAFKGYFILKKYAEKKTSIILNATPNSFIDAFDRIKLN